MEVQGFLEFCLPEQRIPVNRYHFFVLTGVPRQIKENIWKDTPGKGVATTLAQSI